MEFVIEDVNEVLKSNKSGKREIPAGDYNVIIRETSQQIWYDKSDCQDGDQDYPLPDALGRCSMPLDIMDGEYKGETIWLKIYENPDEAKYEDPDRLKRHRGKWNISREKLSKIARALEILSITDTDDCAGKCVTVTMKEGKAWTNSKGEKVVPDVEVDDAKKYNPITPKKEVKAEAESDKEIADDIPF